MSETKHLSGSYYEDYLWKVLRDPQEAVAYINAALEDTDYPEALLMALRNVAMAHGMGTVSQRAKLNRENFYRMLSKSGNPSIRSLSALLDALGLTLRIEKKAA
ncbi:MAG: putative addiction module antidote protein [Deltaproteobacteria bacterium]|nr:putative addiction module antidote protein [Deltaproteobacteria bacterium]